MEIAIISDTHNYLDNKIWNYLNGVDEVWHAGDVGTESILDQLEKVAPLRGVYGNIDGEDVRKRLPEFTLFTLEGVKVGMVHIGGKPYRYPAKVKAWLEAHKPDIYICGHSHILRAERDKKLNLLYLNPGAVGKHGFHKTKTFMLLTLANGKPQNLRVVELGPRGKSD